VTGRYLLEPWWLRTYRDVPALTVSASSAESLERHHGWRNVTVIPEGHVPHPVPDLPKEGEPTIVFLGRLVAMKRPDEALAAFRLLRAELPTARLWVIGDGPLLANLRNDTLPGVELLGRVDGDELAERLTRAHVNVATAVREGWGLNVSEAAYCGTPSVGYATPGLVDSIPASGGLLVEPRPEPLARALVDVLTGRVSLKPTVSTHPWPEVAAAVERRLLEAVASGRVAALNVT
jgi:glycosyltransferase involved in cell wall biosynthesis